MHYLKPILIILLILYIINPFDLIPDLAPIVGWIDDAFLVGVLIYYLKRGRFPGFFFRRGGPFATGQGYYGQSQSTGRANKGSDDSGATSQSKTSYKDPNEILGIRPGASNEEIRTAYRREAQTYHPDKVAHLGQEFQELAQQRFVDIQEAYEKIMGSS